MTQKLVERLKELIMPEKVYTGGGKKGMLLGVLSQPLFSLGSLTVKFWHALSVVGGLGLISAVLLIIFLVPKREIPVEPTLELESLPFAEDMNLATRTPVAPLETEAPAAGFEIATATPTPTATPLATVRDVWYAMALDSAAGVKGRSGPSDSYPEALAALTPGIIYGVVDYPGVADWVIVVLPEGNAAVYPASIFDQRRGNPTTGLPDLIPLPSVDELLSRTVLTEKTAVQNNPITRGIQITVGILGIVAVLVMFLEARGRSEIGDAVESMIQSSLNVIGGIMIPLACTAVLVKISPMLTKNLSLQLEAIVIRFAAICFSAVLLYSTIQTALSPFYGRTRNDDEQGQTGRIRYGWFPRVDFTPPGNVILLAGICAVLGLMTSFALAFGAQAGEKVGTISALWEGFMSYKTPTLTAFINISFMLAAIIYLVENIRSRQLVESIVAVILCAVYFPLRASNLGWHPGLYLLIAMAMAGGIGALIIFIGKRDWQEISWFDLLLLLIAVVCWVVVSFNVL
jgi:hypothetical protein